MHIFWNATFDNDNLEKKVDGILTMLKRVYSAKILRTSVLEDSLYFLLFFH